MFRCLDSFADLEKYPYHIRDVHISDPFILADPVTRRYYTYVQFADTKRFPDVPGGRGKFYVLESEDLAHWSKPQVCFDSKETGFWADLDYWAPECHIWKGKYYLISSFRAAGTYRRCQCLVADSPKGPFRPVAPEPVTPEGWHCLDGTLYVDRGGQPWMVFCHEWLQVDDGQMCAIRLSEDLGHAISDPIILFRATDAPWTSSITDGGGTTDGPFLYRLPGGKLIMLWSSYLPGGVYAMAYATSLSGEITGPWVQQRDPFYTMDGAHGMLFRTFAGQLMLSCHCPNDHMRKRIVLFEMEENPDGVRIINECTGNWYNNMGGHGGRYAYKEPCVEVPCFMQDPRG